MIPLRDNIPPRTTPYVNYLLIVLTSLVFLLQLSSQEEGRDPMIERYGMIPARVMDPSQPITIREPVLVRQDGVFRVAERERPAEPSAVAPWLTLFTCIFLHGGWLHFLGNMWFLHIFGDNVEDRCGHFGFLAFYIVCGLAASLAHLLSNLSSQMPTIGASGAIAGVMGAYFVLYPRARVLTVLPIVIFLYFVVLPAPLFLGVWFLLQFVQGTFSMASEAGGVAWWAHVGGFAMGVAIAALLRTSKLLNPPVELVIPDTQHGMNRSVYRTRF